MDLPVFTALYLVSGQWVHRLKSPRGESTSEYQADRRVRGPWSIGKVSSDNPQSRRKKYRNRGRQREKERKREGSRDDLNVKAMIFDLAKVKLQCHELKNAIILGLFPGLTVCIVPSL